MRERSKFGIAIAAMIKMIATTISNSIREKPFCFFTPSPFPISVYSVRARIVCVKSTPEQPVLPVSDMAALHAFMDGDGRTTGALEALVLQRAGPTDNEGIRSVEHATAFETGC